MPYCRDCGAPITFRETAAGRLQPIDVTTGQPHGAVCPARKPPPAPDDECHRCHSHHVQQEPGTGQHYAGLRCLDCGAHRWLRHPEGQHA